MNFNYMFLLLFMGSVIVPASGIAAADADCPETLNFTKRTLAGKKDVNLCKEYLGKVVIVVNTASKCGFTPQYKGLEALYEAYQDQGFVVLGHTKYQHTSIFYTGILQQLRPGNITEI